MSRISDTAVRELVRLWRVYDRRRAPRRRQRPRRPQIGSPGPPIFSNRPRPADPSEPPSVSRRGHPHQAGEPPERARARDRVAALRAHCARRRTGHRAIASRQSAGRHPLICQPSDRPRAIPARDPTASTRAAARPGLGQGRCGSAAEPGGWRGRGLFGRARAPVGGNRWIDRGGARASDGHGLRGCAGPHSPARTGRTGTPLRSVARVLSHLDANSTDIRVRIAPARRITHSTISRGHLVTGTVTFTRRSMDTNTTFAAPERRDRAPAAAGQISPRGRDAARSPTVSQGEGFRA